MQELNLDKQDIHKPTIIVRLFSIFHYLYLSNGVRTLKQLEEAGPEDPVLFGQRNWKANMVSAITSLIDDPMASLIALRVLQEHMNLFEEVKSTPDNNYVAKLIEDLK